MGTNLVDYYLSRGQQVVNFDIAAPRSPHHKPYWRNVDIRDRDLMAAEMARFRPSHIISLAAQTGTSDRGKTIDYYSTNFDGLRNLVEVAANTPSMERLISASSMLVCRPDYRPQNDTDYCPNTLYGQSKVLGEKVLQEAQGLPYSWIIVRPTGIWGPWFDVPYRNLFQVIAKGLYVHPDRVEVRQSLGFVGNTSCQLDRLSQAPADAVHGRTFYLADEPPLNMQAWTDLIQEAFGSRGIREVPVWMLKAVAKAGDALKVLGWDVPPLSTSRLNNMLSSLVFALDPIIAHNLPYTLEEGVRITVEWMRQHTM